MSTATQSEPVVAQPKSSQSPKFSAASLRAYTIVLALAAAWIIFSVVTDGIFLAPRNLSNLMRQTAVTGILSVGMVLVIISGQIDLSVGSLVGLTGMAAVLMHAKFGLGLAASLLIAVAIGMLIGLFQGWLTAYVQVPSFIVTLGGLLAWRGLAKGISSGNTYPVGLRGFKALGQSYLPQEVGIALAVVAAAALAWSVIHGNRMRKRHGLPSASIFAVTARIVGWIALIAIAVAVLNSYAGVPVPVLIFVLVALAGVFITRQTPFGRYLYAIGGNSEAAWLSGINLRRDVAITFCLLGGLAGIAGIIYTARVGSAGPDAGTLLELDAIAACVIGGASLMGGRGTVFGACLGALFMATLDNGMSLKNVPDFIQDLVKGGILVSAVALDVVGRRRD